MDKLLKQEIIGIINQIQRGDAPECLSDEGEVPFKDVSDYRFDIVDTKTNRSIIVKPNSGTAHYINGDANNTYELRIVCYDDYLHRFTFDDGQGHTAVNRLKSGDKMADFLIFDKSNQHVYFIVHELSDQLAKNKIRTARKQLSDTLNQLYKSAAIAQLIDGFQHKICYLSVKDNRRLVGTQNMADGFNRIYQVLPEPLKFNFGQIGTHHFEAYETSIIELK